jgi:signal transduction histidine kinase
MELVTFFLSSCSLLVLFGLWLIVFGRITPPPGIPHDPSILAFVVALIFGVLFIIQSWVRGQQQSTMDKLAMDLKSANIRLTQLDRIKSEFLSFASHQIKAPMSIIKGYATLMIDGTYGIVNPQVKEIGDKIKKSTDRIITLVDTFLDLRRIQEGKVEYQYETVDLGRLVASVVGELQTLAQAKHITLMLTPMPRAWNVSIDVQRMRQVFQNLIENSIKYTDVGSVVVSTCPEA